MILGRFHDGFPRVTLELPTDSGAVSVEFVLDTGFDGDLAVPSRIARELASRPLFETVRGMADGSIVECPVRQLTLDWLGEEKDVEVLVLDNRALLGTGLLDGCSIEMTIREGMVVVVDCDD